MRSSRGSTISPRGLLAVDRTRAIEPVGEFTLERIRRPMMAYNVLESHFPNQTDHNGPPMGPLGASCGEVTCSAQMGPARNTRPRPVRPLPSTSSEQQRPGNAMRDGWLIARSYTYRIRNWDEHHGRVKARAAKGGLILLSACCRTFVGANAPSSCAVRPAGQLCQQGLNHASDISRVAGEAMKRALVAFVADTA